MLTGYKTYIIAFVGIVVAGSMSLGYIDLTLGNTVLTLLGFGGIATLRAAVK